MEAPDDPIPSPTADTPAVATDGAAPNPAMGRPFTRTAGRFSLVALLSVALLAGAVGGAGGTVAARYWLADGLSTHPTEMVQPTGTGTQTAGSQTVTPVSVASAVYNEVGPSVVQVNVSTQTRFGTVVAGYGSGVVVDEQGLILTNYHVVQGGSTVTVVFSTGEQRQATVAGTDSGNDLALLRVDLPAGIPAARMGDSDSVQVGETVIAIGSPFGLAQTVTQGIVSAVGRNWQPASRAAMHGLIQTDAPINPGNSGGPLVNAAGEVIGINSMIESPVQGSVGVGFAIPINTAKALLPELQAGAQLQRAWLGISGTDLTPAVAAEHGLAPESGVLVNSVVSNSPAAEAGLRGGDVITMLNGEPVLSMPALMQGLTERRPNDSIELAVVRAGTQTVVRVTLGAWPDA